ncbi:hypothetical protein [Arthrobacter sp. CAN_A1]|uniref:hypothetical protein n=1 Tax=Arthrobacter sp. CAN_A1 TaxID=2787717 RepID=UPI001A221F77
MTTLLGDVEQPTVDASSAVDATIASDDRTGLTRRVFGVLIGVTVAGTAAAGGLLVAGASAGPPGVKTSFGSVRLTEAERQLRFLPATGPSGVGAQKLTGTAHGGHNAVGATVQPANSTWGEHLALRLELRNDSDQPVLFAPGQLRLQIGADGPTVTNRDAEAVTGPLPAESTMSLWISFLVPSGETRLSAGFTEPGGGGPPVALELPPVLNRPGSLAVDHD